MFYLIYVSSNRHYSLNYANCIISANTARASAASQLQEQVVNINNTANSVYIVFCSRMRGSGKNNAGTLYNICVIHLRKISSKYVVV